MRCNTDGVVWQTHGSDVTNNAYAPGDMTDYLVHFVNHGDPNGPGDHLIEWPQYDVQDRQQLIFLDGDVPLAIERDDYRAEPFAKLTELSFRFPF